MPAPEALADDVPSDEEMPAEGEPSLMDEELDAGIADDVGRYGIGKSDELLPSSSLANPRERSARTGADQREHELTVDLAIRRDQRYAAGVARCSTGEYVDEDAPPRRDNRVDNGSPRSAVMDNGRRCRRGPAAGQCRSVGRCRFQDSRCRLSMPQGERRQAIAVKVDRFARSTRTASRAVRLSRTVQRAWSIGTAAAEVDGRRILMPIKETGLYSPQRRLRSARRTCVLRAMRERRRGLPSNIWIQMPGDNAPEQPQQTAQPQRPPQPTTPAAHVEVTKPAVEPVPRPVVQAAPPAPPKPAEPVALAPIADWPQQQPVIRKRPPILTPNPADEAKGKKRGGKKVAAKKAEEKKPAKGKKATGKSRGKKGAAVNDADIDGGSVTDEPPVRIAPIADGDTIVRVAGDKHLATDEPVDPDAIRKVDTRRDLDHVPEEIDR